ncbi:dynamin family protein [Paenibacillus sp. CMAA1739]|uniref:dynamin family protein n=1 Tax=Paenibacillus ottowii TaxID=2315729 RepID=UPI00272F9272|nr:MULTISPECIES: dynamin family protein [Paenibacillus]MDP1508628.1 dynamin family protein [Paenibacillus ottowii]MEC4565250.1 dynamin family protein [Paenibacillus sp. CMAA1739]
MMQTITGDAEKWLNTIEQIQDTLCKARDVAGAKAVGDLLEKAHAQELTIAFCGHFSAGKSSLINSLCGKTVLPSGPVPTSANVVSIRNGRSRALIHPAQSLENPEPEIVEASLSELAEYCKNGGAYESIEVWEDIPILSGGGVLLDTPGVDSTDHGHAMATHSALHWADIVFYVMDYNHVQSENNLSFAKSLSDWGKPLYLIINQIDKHRERELSFTHYRNEVENSFHAWQVHYTDILFTSLKEQNHPWNQWEQLTRLIPKLLERKTELLGYSLVSSMRHLVEQHVETVQTAEEEELNTLLKEAGGEEAILRLDIEQKTLQQEDEHWRMLPEQEHKRLRQELDHLLEHAHLTPAELREAAGEYLESRKPGFKTGLWFAGGKTEREKERRLDRLAGMLTDQVEGQLLPHVRELLRSWGEAQGLWTAAMEQELDDIRPVMDRQLVEQTVKENALSSEYTMNYCKDLRAAVTADCRRKALALVDRLLAQLAVRAQARREALADARTALLAQADAASRYSTRVQALASHADLLRSLLPQASAPDGLPRADTPAPAPDTAAVAPPAAAATAAVRSDIAGSHDASVQPRVDAAAAAQPAAGGRRTRLDAAATRLKTAAALVGPYPAMQAAVRDLHTRAAALEGGRFTLALFGAFSAGKSSFANALLGEAVLPVSPHPTTAAINRIMAPTSHERHATADVQMKSADALREDLKYSFRLLGLGEPASVDWQEAVNALSPEGIHPAGRPHYSFLKAAAAGWEEAESLLGQQLQVNLEQYRDFVASERKSCFVEHIDLYYDCALTRQGIVLVDTPGADSVNARHTGVTFNYMKHADALVFVTYYNHAFTQGDRQFLNQLGRVKETLALDQTFFIVNASDLASSEEELYSVTQHVQEQLQANGIRKPRIYPLSSMLALEAAEQGEVSLRSASRFDAFENDFSAFAAEELAGLSIASAMQELRRLRNRIEQHAADARYSAEEREVRLEQLTRIRGELEDVLLGSTGSHGKSVLSDETDELLYHVRQRLAYRTGEFMAEAFHPSVLREGVGDLRSAFASCGRELLRLIELELSQELLATTLRLEKTGQSLVRKAIQECVDHMNHQLTGLGCTAPEFREWAVPELIDISLQDSIQWKDYWNSFKNPKLFFEGTGRANLQTRLEPILRQLIGEAVDHQRERMASFYIAMMQEEQTWQKAQLREQMLETTRGMEHALKGGEEPQVWEELASQIAALESI